MNKYFLLFCILILVLFADITFAQKAQKPKSQINNSEKPTSYWGLSFGFATDKDLIGDIFYIYNTHYFHLGVSWFLDDAKGKEVNERKSNYGLTTNGSGIKYYTIDLKYGYSPISNFEILGIISVGEKKYYTNYIDNRFNEDGYHLINDSEMITGLGVGITYNFTPNLGAFVLYNSVTKFGFGISYRFSGNYRNCFL